MAAAMAACSPPPQGELGAQQRSHIVTRRSPDTQALLHVMAAMSDSEGQGRPGGGPPSGKRPRESEEGGGSSAAAAAEPGVVSREELLKQLECPVCMDTIPPPIHQCEAGHTICGSCKERLPEPRKCPECRVLLGTGRSLALLKLADTAGLTLPCPHTDGGCKESVRYADLQATRTRAISGRSHAQDERAALRARTTRCSSIGKTHPKSAIMSTVVLLWKPMGGSFWKSLLRCGILGGALEPGCWPIVFHDRDAGVGLMVEVDSVVEDVGLEIIGFVSVRAAFVGPTEHEQARNYHWSIKFQREDGEGG